jgi:hypothetical protein
MKKLTSLLIGCSLTLAGAALAQQPVEHQSPSKNKPAPAKAPPAQTHPGVNAGQPHAPSATQQHGAMQQQHGAMQQQQHGTANQHVPPNQPGAVKQHEATTPHTAAQQPGAGKGQKPTTHQESTTAPGTNVSGQAAGGQTPTARQQRLEERKKGMKGQAAAPKTAPNAAQPNAGAAGATQPGAAAGQPNVQANAGAKGKKPDPQKVQQIKSQHANFRAQPKPQQVPAVTFNQNHRVEGAEHWQGPQYQVFRSYHPEWHDQGWYHSHYNRVELIGGGYYFWNAGYWYPAWGYSPSEQYYAYDGPIYVGQHAEPPDRVIADVQGVLQDMGYYKGEVDGLLGPLTREALAAYQADQGLTQTAAIDEPTLGALGMS